jgi:hypothetical protein
MSLPLVLVISTLHTLLDRWAEELLRYHLGLWLHSVSYVATLPPHLSYDGHAS